jgi:hypothetical protein
MSPATRRILSGLPGHGATLGEVRDWLTAALGPPPGYAVAEFTRAGRQRGDPCRLTLEAPGGGRVSFRWNEQRELASASSLRASLYSQCDGLLRMASLSKAELEDVWAALCSLALVLTEQDERDEMAEWLAGFLAVADPLTGYTLTPAGRPDALAAIRERTRFTRRTALELSDPQIDPSTVAHPTVVVDRADGSRWIRASELATYVRHVIGVGIAQGTLDARIGEIDARRVPIEVRVGKWHPKLVLYQLPEDGPDTEGAQ